ncbi:MAG: tripartite tricarboxylate transporter TctB family protein [Nitrospira sp.]|nr:tripartite tricarboxylate transporter TctB family protein [Nitrospira sp.]
MVKADFITSILLILFGTYILYTSIQMPRFKEQGAEFWSVPGLVPGLVGSTILLLALVLLLRSIRQGGYKIRVTWQQTQAYLGQDSSKRLLGTLMLSLFYALGLMGHIHYTLATWIYVFLFVGIYGRQPDLPLLHHQVLIKALLTATLVSVTVTAVFRYLFLVNLP